MKQLGKVISLATITLVAAMSCKGSSGGAGASSAAAVFPKDTAAVVGFSFAKMRKTELWGSLKTIAEKRGGSEVDDIKEACGIDAMTAIDSVVMGIPSDENPKNVAMLLTGNVSESKAMECAKKMAKKVGEEIKVEKSGKVVSFIGDGASDKAFASWLSDNQVLFTSGGKEHLEALLAGKDSLKGNANMMALMKKVDTSATFWGVANLKEGPAASAAAGIPGDEKPVGGYGSLDYTKTLSLKIGLVFENAKAAKAAADALTKEIDQQKANPMVGQYIKDVKVSASGTEAVVSLKMSEEQLTQLTAMVKNFLPMMMGGM